MNRIFIALFVAATAAFPLTAAADTRAHHAAHVTFWVPDNWSVDGDEANQLSVSDPSGEAALLFMVNNARDMRAAADAIDATIARVATDVKVGASQQVQVNGMDGTVVDATGRTDGKRVEISVLVLKTPGNKYLMIFGVLESAHKRAHEADLKRILASLRPAR